MSDNKITLTDVCISQLNQRLIARPLTTLDGTFVELEPSQKYTTLCITTSDGFCESSFIVLASNLQVEGFETINEWIEHQLNQQRTLRVD